MLRKESIPDVLEIDRFSRGGPGLIDGIGSELEELFGRNVLSTMCDAPSFSSIGSTSWPEARPARTS